MIEKNIEIRTPDGVADAIVYRPGEEGEWPGVVHLTDIGGIRRAYYDIAKRLAGEGCVVRHQHDRGEALPHLIGRTAPTSCLSLPCAL